MIQTVKSKLPVNGHNVVPKLLKLHNNQEFKSAENVVIPEGYFTVEEFRKIAIEKGHSFCNKHGII